jgi:hypothetical protein
VKGAARFPIAPGFGQADIITQNFHDIELVFDLINWR